MMSFFFFFASFLLSWRLCLFPGYPILRAGNKLFKCIPAIPDPFPHLFSLPASHILDHYLPAVVAQGPGTRKLRQPLCSGTQNHFQIAHPPPFTLSPFPCLGNRSKGSCPFPLGPRASSPRCHFLVDPVPLASGELLPEVFFYGIHCCVFASCTGWFSSVQRVHIHSHVEPGPLALRGQA